MVDDEVMWGACTGDSSATGSGASCTDTTSAAATTHAAASGGLARAATVSDLRPLALALAGSDSLPVEAPPELSIQPPDRHRVFPRDAAQLPEGISVVCARLDLPTRHQLALERVTEPNATTSLDSISAGPLRSRLLAASILEQWARFSAFARFQAASSRARLELGQSRAALAELGGTGGSAGRAEDGTWVNEALWPGRALAPSPAPAGVGATASSHPSPPGGVEAARIALASGTTGVNDWDAAVRGIAPQETADCGDGPDALAVAALLTAADRKSVV